MDKRYCANIQKNVNVKLMFGLLQTMDYYKNIIFFFSSFSRSMNKNLFESNLRRRTFFDGKTNVAPQKHNSIIMCSY